MITLKSGDTVLFTGDSITHGGRGYCMDGNHILGHGYQEIVCGYLAEKNIESMPKFFNKGVSGRTMIQICEAWENDALIYRPSLISLLAGINDVAKSLDEDTAAATEKYIAAAESILSRTFDALPDVKFFICEPFYLDAKNREDQYEFFPHPVCEPDFVFGNKKHTEEVMKKYREKLDAISAALPKLAKKYGAVYVPFQDIFDEAAKKVHPSYLVWDNIHPTFVGHRLMAKRWLEVAQNAKF
ncbi:MAG: SGNH/GDSL hydrolase family protein [Clostridia bacterium]|nr:SGNH/GDSL hydrolase family protein [Clostridia bacterium]